MWVDLYAFPYTYFTYLTCLISLLFVLRCFFVVFFFFWGGGGGFLGGGVAGVFFLGWGWGLLSYFLFLTMWYCVFRSVLLNIPGFVLIGFLSCLCGVVAFAYYAKEGCDPMTAGYISNPNQVRFSTDVQLGLKSQKSPILQLVWNNLISWKYLIFLPICDTQLYWLPPMGSVCTRSPR